MGKEFQRRAKAMILRAAVLRNQIHVKVTAGPWGGVGPGAGAGPWGGGGARAARHSAPAGLTAVSPAVPAPGRQPGGADTGQQPVPNEHQHMRHLRSGRPPRGPPLQALAGLVCPASPPSPPCHLLGAPPRGGGLPGRPFLQGEASRAHPRPPEAALPPSLPVTCHGCHLGSRTVVKLQPLKGSLRTRPLHCSSPWGSALSQGSPTLTLGRRTAEPQPSLCRADTRLGLEPDHGGGFCAVSLA